jgi:hypothetical protein
VEFVLRCLLAEADLTKRVEYLSTHCEDLV